MTVEPDVAQALAALRQEIKARRERLQGTEELGELRGLVRQVNANWQVSAHLPITWDGPPLLGRGLAYAKRVTRLLLRWYVNPIVEQQNNFNATVTRALLQTTAYLEQTARADYALQQRLETLEKHLLVISEDVE